MQLRFQRYDLRLIHNWMVASSQATGGKTIYPAVLLELQNDAGLVGYGEAAPSMRYHENAQTCLEFFERVDPARLSFADVEASMCYVESLSAGDFSPKGALNVALLDGAAKSAHQPLHEFLELGFIEGRHVSSITIGLDTPEMMRRKTLEAVEFPILKLKVGSPEDSENLAAVREVAPQKTLRLDANEAWKRKEEALRRIEYFARDANIEYIEQPMPASSAAEDLIWLKERSPLPVVGDESYMGARDAGRCAESFHGVNVKLAKTGGISHAVEALRAARRCGLKTMIGSMVESSILTSAGAHLAALADWLDLDGMLLINNDPFRGVTSPGGVMSFADAPEPYGLQAAPQK